MTTNNLDNTKKINPEHEFGGNWEVQDFIYYEDTVIGFSDSGKNKLEEGNTSLWIPPVNMHSEEVKKISCYAFEHMGLSSIESWGNVTFIGAEAFSDNRITNLPDDWGKITFIGNYAFSHNKITDLPDSWGKITHIGAEAFSDNKITTLPGDWDEIIFVGKYVFAYNQITSRPDSWGKVTSVRDNVFAYNQSANQE